MQEQINKMMEDKYDISMGDSFDSYMDMIRAFYGKRMRWVAVIVWMWSLIFLAMIIISLVIFIGSEVTKTQIICAALFVSGWVGIGVCKEMAWSMVNKNLLSREIKRLEIRVAELSQIVREK